MLAHHRPWLTPALLALYGAAPVWAQDEGPLRLKAETSLRFDSNLFRLPAGANTAALIGKPSAAEQISITLLSLNFSKTLSLQRLELSLNVTDYRYQNFNYLSFTANNYNAAWRWALTPRLHGNLTSERRETLNSFADYQGYNQRNQRTDTHTRFDAVYELDGTWRVIGGVAQSAQTNQQAVVAEGDYSATSADLGLGYAFASGSLLTYTRRNANGQYLNRVLPSAGLYDDGFSQTDNELKLHWAITGKSTADLSAAQISRSHPHYAQRDYSGLNTGVNLNWNITAKSALAAGWARELASYQTSTSNYSQTDRLSLGPVWQLSAKAVMRLRYEVAQRDFLGAPTGPVATPRSDITTDTALSFDWQPNQYLTLSTALLNATRSSNLAGLDYESRMAVVSAQFSY